MKIAGVQLAVSRENLESNHEAAKKWIRKAAEKGARIICLQEFFSTGGFTWERNPEYFHLAQTIHGDTVSDMCVLAKELSVSLLVPFYEKDETVTARYYNTVAVISSNGTVVGKYRKQFLPLNEKSNEKYYYSLGNLGTPVFHIEGLCFAINVCFDRHFFELQRIAVLKGAEVIFLPTSTSKNPGRYNVWEAELISMAVNNGVYVVGVNSTGSHDGKPQFGSSMIVDPMGNILEKLGEEEGIVIAEFDHEAVLKARNKYFLTRDYRPEFLNELKKLYYC